MPTYEDITAPTADSPHIAVMRFEANIGGKLKNRTQTDTAKPTTNDKPGEQPRVIRGVSFRSPALARVAHRRSVILLSRNGRSIHIRQIAAKFRAW